MWCIIIIAVNVSLLPDQQNKEDKKSTVATKIMLHVLLLKSMSLNEFGLRSFISLILLEGALCNC